MTIFNHDVLASSPDVAALPGAMLYASRALALTRPGDLLQLPIEAARAYPEVVRHYQKVGIDCTRQIIWNMDEAELAGYPNHDLSAFYFSPEVHRYRPDAAWLELAGMLNSKNRFVHVCRTLSLPVPRTECWDEPASFQSTNIPFPLFLKLDQSVSGMGVFRCSGERELRALLNTITGSFQLQEELKAAEWLNVQYETRGGEAVYLATTTQILHGVEYQGSRYPTHYDPRPVTDPLAAWMVSRGMKGVFAIDVAVCPDTTGRSDFLLIEVNPRYNGSTYYHKVAERLGASSWSGRSFSTAHRNLSELRFDRVAYGASGNFGAVIVNWALIAHGRLGLLLVGTDSQQQEIEQQLDAVL